MSKANATVYRIAAVATLPGSRLRVEYVGGNVIEVDLSEPIARSRSMRHLANPGKFAAVHVGENGWMPAPRA